MFVCFVLFGFDLFLVSFGGVAVAVFVSVGVVVVVS